ncbi:hypothetical protein EVAR_31600_1 [Eumeta japonica]|uniref:Uncharacterized protein n=1 Tax=Eumeta variegata TaxID=151549 RepID=A0A4C1VY06_EUMVA|nr:hypothetical protein EVAR_31600_1 [Eumeta japonica]
MVDIPNPRTTSRVSAAGSNTVLNVQKLVVRSRKREEAAAEAMTELVRGRRRRGRHTHLQQRDPLFTRGEWGPIETMRSSETQRKRALSFDTRICRDDDVLFDIHLRNS